MHSGSFLTTGTAFPRVPPQNDHCTKVLIFGIHLSEDCNICVPCVSWSLRTLAIVTYAQLCVVILLYQLHAVCCGPRSFTIAEPTT